MIGGKTEAKKKAHTFFFKEEKIQLQSFLSNTKKKSTSLPIPSKWMSADDNWQTVQRVRKSKPPKKKTTPETQVQLHDKPQAIKPPKSSLSDTHPTKMSCAQMLQTPIVSKPSLPKEETASETKVVSKKPIGICKACEKEAVAGKPYCESCWRDIRKLQRQEQTPEKVVVAPFASRARVTRHVPDSVVSSNTEEVVSVASQRRSSTQRKYSDDPNHVMNKPSNQRKPSEARRYEVSALPEEMDPTRSHRDSWRKGSQTSQTSDTLELSRVTGRTRKNWGNSSSDDEEEKKASSLLGSSSAKSSLLRIDPLPRTEAKQLSLCQTCSAPCRYPKVRCNTCRSKSREALPLRLRDAQVAKDLAAEQASGTHTCGTNTCENRIPDGLRHCAKCRSSFQTTQHLCRRCLAPCFGRKFCEACIDAWEQEQIPCEECKIHLAVIASRWCKLCTTKYHATMHECAQTNCTIRVAEAERFCRLHKQRELEVPNTPTTTSATTTTTTIVTTTNETTTATECDRQHEPDGVESPVFIHATQD